MAASRVLTRHWLPGTGRTAAKLVFDIVTAPTRAKLADGRGLLFFSLPGHCRPRSPIARPLPARGADQSQLRFDRSDRAVGDHRGAAPRPHLQAASRPMPLCPGPTGLTSEVPAPDYDVVVFENRFASLSGPGELTPAPAGDGFVSARGMAAAR